MRPPSIIEKLLTWLCRDPLLEEILGDLEEQYFLNLETKGSRKAKIIYVISGIRFINFRTLKKSITTTNNAMFKNYIVIALRNILRQKVYSIINIGGLAIGIACSILLGLYVYTELSFDRFHSNAEQILVAHMEYDFGNGEKGGVPMTPTALLPYMVDQLPEVKRGARVFFPVIFKPVVVSQGNLAFQEKGFCYADSTFLQMFSFNLIEGDASSVLDDPGNIVITESSKLKYFGDGNAIGESILVDDKTFIVAGILEDIRSTSSIQFDFVAPFSAYWKRDPIWGSANYQTYIELNQAVNSEILSSKIQTELRKLGYSDPANNQYFGIGFTPFLDMHLYSDLHGGGDITSLYVFSSIALLILLIAIINYANLATARSFHRAKEVGLRKSLGANRSSVVAQIIGESFVTSLFSMLLALLLAYMMLPIFAMISGVEIHLSTLLEPAIIFGIICMYLLIGLLSGLYPAVKMSSFNPAEILKGQFKGSGQGSSIRKALIIIQFSISISLMIATVVIYNQLNYINSMSLGYDKDNIIVVPVSDKIIDKATEFKNLMKQSSFISDATIAGETPPNIQGGYSVYKDGDNSFGIVAASIDEGFLGTMKMKLVSGSNITEADIERTREAKEYSFLINESTLELLEWTAEEAVGQEINLNGREGVVKGVISNFNFRALYEDVSPLVLFTEQTWGYNYGMIKVSGNDLPSAIEQIEASWKQIDPDTPFSYSFLDQEYSELHQDAARSGDLLSSFALLAIFIASLGLFGIVSFSMVQRSKELGVRKVLGASTSSLLLTANKEFSILIVISFIVAAPLTYWLMQEWLGSFAYRIEIGIWPLLLGFFITAVIAVVTISYESMKAAMVNPTETLRAE